MMLDPMEELRQRFKLVCRKCGSEDVVIDYEPAQYWSEYTQNPATLSVGCNGCKDNDFRADI